MGRLQRKKPVSKKKKKGNGGQGTIATDAENKIVSLTDFSKNKKKQTPSQKKKPGVAKPANAALGHWEKGMQFLREVRIELKKVTWPSRAQTMGSTAVVIILVIIISFFLGLVDMGLSGLVRLILH